MTLPHTNAVLQSSSIRMSNYDGPVTSGLKCMAELNREPHKSVQVIHMYSVST